MAQKSEILTAREEEALVLLARGMCTHEVAAAMCVTAGSLQNILLRVREKLAVSTSTQAVVWAWSRGLVDQNEALHESIGCV